MIGRKPAESVGLKTVHSSGVTTPWTMNSPRPYEPVTTTASRKPESGSRVKITPELALSERTIGCTPTEMATWR
jgi:hypothetical protein